MNNAAKLNELAVQRIRQSTDCRKKIAAREGVHTTTIDRVLNFKTWKDCNDEKSTMRLLRMQCSPFYY